MRNIKQNILIGLLISITARPGSIEMLISLLVSIVNSGPVWGTVTPSTRVRIPARALKSSALGINI